MYGKSMPPPAQSNKENVDAQASSSSAVAPLATHTTVEPPSAPREPERGYDDFWATTAFQAPSYRRVVYNPNAAVRPADEPQGR